MSWFSWLKDRGMRVSWSVKFGGPKEEQACVACGVVKKEHRRLSHPYKEPKMKSLLLLCLLLMPMSVSAKPYFRVKPLSKLESGAFFKLGTPQGGNVQLGMISPVIWHDSKDGYFLVPGVDWTLVNVGFISPTDFNRASLVLGPSVSLDEPIKAFLRLALRAAPGDTGSYGMLSSILAPSDDKEKLYLSVGPMWALDTGNWRGSLQIGTTLSRRF